MSFEDVLRQKIAAAPSKVAKSILKVVLGEFQQKNTTGKATEADGYKIIEKIVNGNNETLGYLKADDARASIMQEENEVVSALLPTYLTADEVLLKIIGEPQLLADVKSAKGDGQATGVVSKWCKAQKLEAKGDVIKEVVTKIRATEG
mgnify:CR=1 FL=1